MLDLPEGPGFGGAAGFNGNIQVAQNHGFRVFRYDTVSQSLRSLVFDYEWTPGVNKAVCATSWDWDTKPRACPYPNKKCSHGFYAYYGEDYYTACGEEHEIILAGVINGYGRCVIGDKGYRSEYANLVALVAPTTETWQREVHAAALTVLERKYPTVPIFSSADELLKVIPLPGRPPRND